MKKTLVGLLAAGLVALPSFGAVTITTATGGTNISADKAQNATTPAFTTLGNIVLTEGASGDFATPQTSTTLILSAPAGWRFNPGVGSVTQTAGKDVTSSSIVVGSTNITVTLNVSGATKTDALTISGIQVQPTSGSTLPASGSILRLSSNPGTANISGSTNVSYGSLSQVAGTVAKVNFTTQPGSATAGSVFGVQPVIRTEDQFGNASTSGLATSLNVTATLSSGTGVLSGTVARDIGTAAGNGTVSYTDLSIHTAGSKQLTMSASSLTSAVSSSFTVAQVVVTPSITAANKTYDGTSAGTITTNSLTGVLAGDTVSLSIVTATFANKNVGTGKTVTATGLTLTGVDAGNYTLSSTTAATTANITARFLTVSATGVNKGYDGTTNATVTLSDDRISGDSLTTSYTGASFANKNVGTAKAVSVSGISISGTDAGNYSCNTTTSTTANISGRSLTVSATGVNKSYDGTTNATVTLSDDRLSGDSLTASYTASFADKNVGTAKAVSVSGISISGTDAGNYSCNTTTSTTANITRRSLTVSATGVNKIYDGTTNATVTLSDDRISGDSVTTSYTGASFATKNVGAGKVVSVSGISISGTDSGNYSCNTTTSTTANISGRTLTVSATGVNKGYDGTTNATVTLSDDRISGDSLTTSYTSASFADKNVGTAKAVSVSGISISGADAANYSCNTTTSTTANITGRSLTVSATGVNKIYDGTINATVTLSDDRLSGDSLAASYTAASFANKNVGTAKAVSVSGISITGTDAGNYSCNTTTGTTASITGRSLTVSATGVNKGYDGTTNATVTLSDDRISGDSLTTSYTSASFANKNVGTAKAVSVSGISISGADAGNYSCNTTSSTTANITGRILTVSATGVAKVYDGTADATVTLSDDRSSGDDLTTSYTGASFTNKNVGTGKPVNVIGISISGSDSGNYSFNTTASTTANVTARVLTVSATGVNKVYDGTTNASITLLDDRINGDSLTESYTASFENKNVGTNKAVSVTGISVTGTDSGNYSLANTTAAATADIAVTTLTVSATGVNKVYDGTTNATVTLSDDRLSGDSLTTSYTASFTDKNVGAVKSVNVTGISISGSDAGNYSLTNTTAATTADITASTLTVSATGVVKTYDGTADATVTLSDDRFSGDSLTASYTGASFTDKNVGTAKAVSVSGISISGVDSGNYSFNTRASTTANITARALTVNATGANKIYDGTIDATVTLSDDRISGDSLTASYTVASFADKNVGTNKAVNVAGISITGTDSGNYTFNTTVNTTAQIFPRGLTGTADDKSRAYGAENPVFTVTYAGFVDGDDSSDISGTLIGSTPATNNSPLGTYPISVSGQVASNYTITYVGGTLTVTPYALVAVAGNATQAYGSTNTLFTGSLSGVQHSDDITVTFETTNVTATSPVGSYDIIPVLHDPNMKLTNYTVLSTNGVLMIEKAILTVTADNQSRLFGNTNGALTVAYSGFVNGETNDVLTGSVGVTTAAATNSPVGTYGIVVSVGTLTATNYDFAFVDGNLTVLAAPLVGQADSKARVYGDENPEFTVTYSGFVNGENTNVLSGTLVGSTSATTNSSIGTYPISVSGQTAGNYTVTYVDGTLTVSPAAITVVADNASKTYGSANPGFTGTLNGVRNADDITATYETLADATTAVGAYDITSVLHDSTSKLGNYTVAYTNGTLAITKATVIVTAGNKTKVYGTVTPAFTASYSGFQNADSTNILNGSPAFTLSPTETGVGSYAIVPAAGTLSATNYDFSFVNGTLTVTPASLTITAENKARSYGESNPTFTATYVGFVNGDTTNALSGLLSFDTTATDSSAVGAYPISVSGQTSSNYHISFVDGILTVGTLTLTATVQDVSRTYGATNPVFNGTLSANADGITATFESAATTNSPVGTYAIIPVFNDPNGKLSNYIVQASGTLTIDRAPVTVAADDVSRGYGATNSSFTGTISGVQNNEDISATFSSATTTTSPVGNYVIHAELFATNGLGASDVSMLDNYLITTNGVLTITNASIVVTVNNTSKAYGASNPSLSGLVDGVKNGDNITASYSTVAVEGSPIGTYAITATLSDNSTGVLSNYTVSVNEGTLTVAGSGITVVANSTNKVYGAENPEFTGTLSGAAVSDGITVTYVTTADTNSSVGDYTITPVLDDHGNGSLSNYLVNATPGTLAVTKAALVIGPVNKGVGVGTNTPALTAVLSGVKNNDFAAADVACALSPARTKLALIADYTITVTNIADPLLKLANYTVITNSGTFRVMAGPAFTTVAPVGIKPKTTVAAGTRVTMSVVPKGTTPSYQWTLNGLNIPGATSATNIISAVTLAQAGDYSVIVTNFGGSVTSAVTALTVFADTNVPVVAIKSPADKNATSSTTNVSGAWTVWGTMGDNAQITNVYLRLNGGAWAPVTTLWYKDANALAGNWTNNVSLAVGTNILESYSVDWSGNTSKVAKVTFYYNVPALLTVSMDHHDTREGEGTNSAWPTDYRGTIVKLMSDGTETDPLVNYPTNGAKLYVNRGPYTLKAIAGHNQTFTNWSVWTTGGTTQYVGTATYSFVMQTNLNLVANFIHNPWMEAQGLYYGLFTNETTDYSISGGINLKVLTNQVFSGKAYVDGDVLSVAGTFKTDATATVTVSRAKFGKKPLTLSLTNLFGTAGSSGTNQIVGTFTDGTLTSTILADQWVYASSNYASPAQYTMILPKADDASVAPGGYGYASVTVSTQAKVVAVGSFAESSIVAPQLGYVTLDGRYPMFNQMYLAQQIRVVNYTNNVQFHTNATFRGLYMGWMNLTNPAAGTLHWVKDASSVVDTNILMNPLVIYSNYYPAGFSLDMPLTVKPYVVPAVGSKVISVSNAIVSFADGNLTGIQTNAIRYQNDLKLVLLSNNVVWKVATNTELAKLAVALDAKIGKMTATFTNVATAVKPISGGAVLQPDNIGYGYFLGTNQSGSVIFRADAMNP